MRSNYKKLGQFIQEIDVRNLDLSIKTLLGVTITKKFIPSVANTHGVDLASYKVIKKDQFACKLMSVGRDEQLPVNILKDFDRAIVSSAYYVFESKDINVLNPDYLMMWLSRGETDRWVGFISGGDVRGGISWDAFCEMPIIVPSKEKQKEIVKEYHVVTDRIKLNEQINQKLEETAQAIYKQWFIDFEFPVSKEYAQEIGKPELEGKPYKSNGGEMEWNEELEQKIPKGWSDERLDCAADIKAGGDKPKIVSSKKTDKHNVPIYSNSSINEGLFGYTSEAKIYDKSITISARGAIIGYTVLRLIPFVPIVRLIIVTPKHDYLLNYLFKCIKNFRYSDSASAQGQLTIPEISSFKIIKPHASILKKYQDFTSVFIENIEKFKMQILKLEEMKGILLSKITQTETIQQSSL